MRKTAAIIMTLIFLLALAGCGRAGKSDETVSFHGNTVNRSDLSPETLDWLGWYNGLSEEEQLAISYIPTDLHRLCGYGAAEDVPAEYAFQATVLEVRSDSLLVEPCQGAQERSCADRFVLVLPEKPAWPMPQVGDRINIVYNGRIEESYPARIPNLYRVEILAPAEE